MSTPKFIVVFKEGVTSEEITNYIKDITSNGGQLDKRFDEDGGILNGFSAAIPEAFLDKFKSLQGDKIDYVEPDGVMTIQPVPSEDPQ